MKLIQKIKEYDYIDFIYENEISKRVFTIKGVFNSKEIIWFDKNGNFHKEDGAAIQKCNECIKKTHYFKNNNKYKRHFYLNGTDFSTKEFAGKTKHIICLICNDFCKQECFI